MQLGFGFWASRALLSAVELRIFGLLAQTGPLDAEQLRDRLGLHPRGARDFSTRSSRSGCSTARTAGTRTRWRPTSSSTRAKPPTWVACWRCPVFGCIGSGGR
nr:methyltransferase dimerization domain-containing protein [Mycobacterium sp. ACS1612]